MEPNIPSPVCRKDGVEIHAAVPKDITEAVSYTHLDVYKRQAISWQFFSSGIHSCPVSEPVNSDSISFIKIRLPPYTPEALF